MIKLCRANLQHITTIKKPDDKIFLLPEKVLQFGTGVLLRGLPDYFIDKANRQNIFNGRIVVVKSTTKNNIDNFETQDGLYTLCMRGLKNNVVQSVNYLCASISRVIDANKNWNNVLACAENPSIEIIISNTTEVGFALNEQDKIFTNSAPLSFPAKLLAFLYRRYTFFKGDATMGIVIIPTELISENGTVLKNICLDLAHIHQLGNSFIQWIETANEFCDSLVDRIVPGKPDKEFKNELSQSLGYEDDLMIMSESYVLWAIQARSPLSQKKLSFHLTDDGAIVTNNIEKYKTLKLYLLNATHTFSCILAIAGGFKYVNEALDNGEFEQYIKDLLLNESAPSLTNETISFEEAENFAIEVIHRFKNPFIKHKWSDIARQMTIKIRLRCVPLILLYHAKFHRIPSLMIKGFSAFLFFMRSYKYGEDDFIGVLKNNNYCIEDQNAKLLHEYWLNKNTDEGVRAIIADKDLWGTDLGLIDGFKDAVINEITLFGNERK